METLKINVLNNDAMAILYGMEQAGLIVLPKKEIRNKYLSKQLRGAILGSRAKEMIEANNTKDFESIVGLKVYQPDTL